MGVTYVTRQDRGRMRGLSASALGRDEIVLLAIALTSLLAIGLCYAGRLRVFEAGEASRSSQPLNLADLADADAIEPALAPAFSHAGDQRFAARELLAALATDPLHASLVNVGSLARIEVPVASVDRARHVVVFAERLREARSRAAAAKTAPPVTLPLLTSADLTALKPGFVVRTRESHRRAVFWCTVVFLLGFQIVSLLWRFQGFGGDRQLLAAAHLLATLGFVVMLSRPDPLRDTLLLVRYTLSVAIGLAVCVVVSRIKIHSAAFLRLSYVSLAAAVVISITLLIFGSGPGTSGAKVNLGPAQPIEAIRLLVAFFLAGYLGRRWELVREIRETAVRGRSVPAWLNVPRLDHMLPLIGGVGLSLLLFFAMKDLGPALLLSLMFLAMLAVARGRPGMVLAGIGMLAAGFYGGYWLGISRTLAARVGMWLSPWENSVRGGDQIAHAAWATATGGIQGTGLGLGDTRYIPAGHTDLVLAAVGEELGVVGVLAAAVACGLIAWRGLRIARAATSDAGVFLAIAMTLSLVAPMLVMAAGIVGLIPLTGVVTPFLSYGGSAMVANFAALGLLVAIGSQSAGTADTQPFHVPLRWLARTMAAAAVVLLVMWGRVQVASADQYLIKPQLGLQADGGLRYQYNPRVLDAARTLPRGTIFDRRDVPLAASPEVLRAATAEYASMRVSPAQACAGAGVRCYPLGGRMFHILGDATTRANWSATNSSYVERDEEDGLRGFNDRSIAVRAGVGDEQPTVALRRDYRELVPLVRHRWEPDHPDVKALATRPRDLRLTIDARLHVQVSAILARTAVAAGIERAAVVVLDAETGELLTSVSYPWPDASLEEANGTGEAMLDRARYGLFPPGSTFKLVTAAAALRQDPSLSQMSFACTTLPGGRVGAKIPGFGRPVKDDVHDRHPHGTIAMHDGLVRSCNAYFAQLAVRLGSNALANTARQAGVSYPVTGDAARVRENLPHAGYGQGLVLATPLRMARIAAAIGSDGTIREPSIVRDAAPREPRPFLAEDPTRLLASYMRDVVTNGTGQALRNHPGLIAGKTGTAEVDGAEPHAWFVGFAPYGPATHRIAFAVILENAGYGGVSAASVAGQVVTAAASLGLVR